MRFQWFVQWRVGGGDWTSLQVPDTVTTVPYPVQEIISVLDSRQVRNLGREWNPSRPGGGTVRPRFAWSPRSTQVLASPVLHRHFVGVPMEVLVAKQTSFIETASSEEIPVTRPPSCMQLHAHLRIDDTDFDEMIATPRRLLHEHGVEPTGCARLIHDSFKSFRSVHYFRPAGAS